MSALSLTDSQIADEIQELTGQRMTRQLITDVANGQPIPAMKADSICTWLSREYGRKITPEHIADLKIPPLSVSAGTGGESIAFKAEKVKGFVAGWQLAFTARSSNRTLSHQEIREQATTIRVRAFQESAGHGTPLKNTHAYENAYVFAANSLDVIFSRPGGVQKYAEWVSWLPVQRETYAREMAEQYLCYL